MNSGNNLEKNKIWYKLLLKIYKYYRNACNVGIVDRLEAIIKKENQQKTKEEKEQKSNE